MRDHLEHGHVVVCVSATFEPIVAKAMTCHPVQFGIATRMQIDDDGCYTDRVDGLPVEGAEKVVALKAFADELFGAGRWVLEWAYGDHHPIAICSRRLGMAARSRPIARSPAPRASAATTFSTSTATKSRLASAWPRACVLRPQDVRAPDAHARRGPGFATRVRLAERASRRPRMPRRRPAGAFP